MCTVGNSKTLKQPKHPLGGDGYINDMTYRRENTAQHLKRTGQLGIFYFSRSSQWLTTKHFFLDSQTTLQLN